MSVSVPRDHAAYHVRRECCRRDCCRRIAWRQGLAPAGMGPVTRLARPALPAACPGALHLAPRLRLQRGAGWGVPGLGIPLHQDH